MFQELHWHEGQFLQPHHFQRFQKGLVELVAAQRALVGSFAYGVVAMDLSETALGQFKVEFTRLHAVMPGGLEIAYQAQPGSTGVSSSSNTLLAPLDLKPALSSGARSLSVRLAVPRWAAERANSLGLDRRDLSSKVRYDFYDAGCYDENTGQNSKPVRFRRLRARLLLGDEDATDYETLELLRVRPVFAEGASVSVPQRDFDFVPPLLVLAGSQQLAQLLLDLLHNMANVRDDLANRMRQAGYTPDNLLPGQLLSIVFLKTLDGALGRLKPLLQAVLEGQAVSPFLVYRELRGLHGELAALQLGGVEAQAKRVDGFESYRHDDPWPCFDLVVQRIQDLLRPPNRDKPLSVEFQPLPNAMYKHVADLTDEHVSKPNAWFLGIRTGQNVNVDIDKLYAYVLNAERFRVLPATLVEQGILVPGIPLVRPRHVPAIFPGHSDSHYFRLDIQNSPAGRWDQISNQRRIAISRIETELREAGIDLRNAQFTLFMTLPPQSK